MNFESRLQQAFDAIAERVREDVARELHAAVPSLAGELTALQAPAVAPPAPPAPRTEERLHRIVAALRELDDATSLSDVLDTLLWGARRESSRACLLLIRGECAALWRAAGFGDAFDAQVRTHPLQIALTEAGVIGEAVRSRDAVSSRRAAAIPPAFAAPSSARAVAAAIRIGGQPAAVLYAERTSDTEGEDASSDEVRSLIMSVELLTRHASRCLEAITAFRTAQLFTQPAGIAGAAHSQGAGLDASDGWVEDDADAARRYARLLISEIKLYHEPAVIAGRRDRNLASRLGGEIARARALYEQRVPAALERRADYFDAEVVRTLANGDVSLLGVAN